MPLYPPIETVIDRSLQVDKTHTLYIEEMGNPQGVPVLFLHGGPGGNCNTDNHRYFDPAHYRIILFDQRGSGRSTPIGSISNNTTEHLLHDIERIRQHLNVERWVLFAGSWGSTLSLLYAQAHPQRVLGMVLRGSFLARQRDWMWFSQDGGPRFFPQIWAELMDTLPPESSGQTITERLYHAVFSDDETLSQRVSVAWQYWGRVMVNRSVDVARFAEADWASCVNHSRIELHYAKHGYFIRENQILDNMHRLPNVPVQLIHGQLDWICPVESSYLLAQAIDGADLQVLEDVGHIAGEVGMRNALREAADWFLGDSSGLKKWTMSVRK